MDNRNGSSVSSDGQRSRTSSLGRGTTDRKKRRSTRSRSKSSYLRSKIVGPTKAYITKTSNKARKLIADGTNACQVLSDLQDASNTEVLGGADRLLIELKKAACKIRGFENFMGKKFQHPDMQKSEERETFLQEVQETLAAANAEDLLVETEYAIAALEANFAAVGFIFTPFHEEEEFDTAYDQVESDYNPDDIVEDDDRDAIDAQKSHFEPHPTINRPKTVRSTQGPLQFSSEAKQDAQRRETNEQDARIFLLKEANWKLQLEAANERNLQRDKYIEMQDRMLKAMQEAKDVNALLEVTQAQVEKLTTEDGAQRRSDAKDASENNGTQQREVQQTPPETTTTFNTVQADTVQQIDSIEEEEQSTKTLVLELRKAFVQERDQQKKATQELTKMIAKQSENFFAALANADTQSEDYARRYERGVSGRDDTDMERTRLEVQSPVASPLPVTISPRLDAATPINAAYSSHKFNATKYLTKFDGNGDLELFQTEFDRIVMHDEHLTPSDKYLLLRNIITGDAKTCLMHTARPDVAITKTFEMLNKVYGKKQTRQNLLKKFTKLPFDQTNPDQMRLDLVAHLAVLERLRERGVQDNDQITAWDIVTKLPPNMRQDLAEYLVIMGDNLSHDRVIEKISTKIDTLDMDNTLIAHGNRHAHNEITALASINLMNSTTGGNNGNSRRGNDVRQRAYDPSKLPAEYVDPVTQLKLPGYYAPGSGEVNSNIFARSFPAGEERFGSCAVCDGKHNAMRCPLNSQEFRSQGNQKGLCPICVRRHQITECRSSFLCGYCGGKHHMGGCPKKEYYRDAKNWPSGFSEKDIEKYLSFVSRPKPPHCVNMISPPEKDNSYRLTFMCLTRPDNSYLLALVDSGASLSVMCPETARELGLEVKGQTDMSIQGFNSESRFRTNIYVLSLRSTSKDETLSFLVTGASMPQTAYRAPNLSRYDSQYAIDHGINLQTVLMSRRYQNKRIDMILGNDLIAWIGSVASYRKYTLPSGRSLEETPLGTIVHPVPNIKIWKPDPKDAVNTVDAVDALDASDDSDDSDARGPVLSQVTTADVLQQGPEPENSMERLTLEVSLMRRVENIGIENVTIQDAEKKTTNDLLAAFFESVRYNQDGDVEVALPYNGNQVRLANNRGVAYRRLKSLLNQLSMRGKDHLQKYNDIIMEQLLAGYIEIVTREMMCLDLPQYYIPHRVVVKEDSLTTKLRVVLDASSHAAGELSLNECLHAGSNMVTPIYGILIRARCTRYIVVADIQKAFHQVRLQPEFRNVTFFMWLKDVTRPPTDDNIVVYRFTRIPFGVASSPFLLAAYILHCLNSNPDELNKEIIENLYVDNCLFCTNDRDAIRSLISRTRAIFTKMKMNLREYIVNDPETMSNLDTEIRASADAIKLLGYTWDSKLDTLAIKIAQLDAKHPTKQEVASKMAGTFDPLGFLSPIMVPFKRLIQRLWSHSMNWKDKIPMECIADWRALQNAFSMQVMTVPRQITTDYEYSRVELLMFSDASQDIYAAVCYACFFYADRRPEIRLLTSKNKIKPSKSERWTIPKLELMGIECASTMAATVVKELRLTVSQIRLFTDSSCALYWILSLNNKRVWVANRIDAIQQNQLQMRECGIDTTIHHCPTKENPADLATRGMSTADLQECDFWFSGPSFLKLPQEEWPCKIEGTVSCPAEFQDLVYAEIVDPVTQRKKKPLLPRPKPAPRKKGTMLFLDASRPQPSFIPFSSTNSMAKLTKIVLIVLRAFKNSKTLQGRRWESYTMRAFASETSTLQQVKLARSLIIAEHYKDCIYRQLFFPKTLQHYVGCDGLWRWRRNVSSPVLPQEAAEPVLVHADHPLAAMIVWETHLITGHQPEAYVRSAIRTKYWIPMDATLIRQIVGACVKCKKVTGLPYAYPFSQVLPSCRVTPSKPFSKVGLDYLGPVQYRKDDGKTLGKAWIIIYTCLCTRGAILRVIPNNTSEKYILTLKMIFREVGVPTEIYSDNATTFKLGAKVINRDINDLECSHSLASYLAAENINYRYITPLSPWQGGVYERVVGIVKHQMMKECGKEIYDWHGLQYVVSGAQGMVNNRPLMPHARSPDDMIVLRPIDFQCPGVMIEVPWSFKHPKDATSSTEKTLRAHVNKLERTLEQMWKLWSVGYLTHLRKNMHKDSRCSTLVPSVGQIVIVSTNLVSRHKWPLGRIIEVIRSEKDGQIRSAVVRCQDSVLTRSVCQLVPLEVCAYATEAPQDAEEEEKRKRQEFEEAYKAKPILPSPAYFDNPGTKYAPEMFPAGRFPSIATEAETTPRQLDLETFNEKIKNHPRIGDAEEGRDGRELIPLEDDGSEGIAVDPTPNNNDLGRAELDATYEGRSRASLSRSTKSKPVNYVHSADIDAPSRPFTPQCCQCYSEMRTFPRWKLL